MMAGDPVASLELLRRTQAGDEEARIQLILRMKDSVVRQVRKILGSDNPLADDIAWDAIVQGGMLASKCRAGSDREVYGWFRAIGRNAALQELRCCDEASSSPIQDEKRSSRFPTPPGVHDEMVATLEIARERLDARKKLILNLRLDQNLSWAEIGGELRIAPDAARMAFSRAVLRLKADTQDLMLQRAAQRGDDVEALKHFLSIMPGSTFEPD